jgi:hypothetical protein
MKRVANGFAEAAIIKPSRLPQFDSARSAQSAQPAIPL